MKIPKTLKLFGYVWKVKIEYIEEKDGGGSFNWKNKEISINNKYKEKECILLHEIIEAILVKDLTRYYGNEGNSEWKFMFNHTEFCKIVYDIYQVLKDNKLI